MNRYRIFRWITIFLLFMIGCPFIAFHFCTYTFIKLIGDHLSKDGNLSSLTPQLFSRLQIPVFIIGCFLIILAVAASIWPTKTEFLLSRTIQRIKFFALRLQIDTLQFTKDLQLLRITRSEGIILLILVFIALGIRLLFINRPIEYDEAYTFTEFARYPLKQIMSDYSAVNNHIFHTILVHITYILFGDSLWAIRLPVLLSGLLMIPLVFLVGRTAYDRYTGLTAAAWATVYPLLVMKTVSARGYAIIATLTLVCFLLGIYLLKRNNSFAWFLLSLWIAVGIFTNPTMIYAFVCLFCWLCVTRYFDRNYKYIPGKLPWYRNLFLSGMSTICLSIFFYSPIILSKGAYIFAGNRVVDTLSLHEFINTLPQKIYQFRYEWSIGIPDFFIFILLIGIITAIFFPWKDSKFNIPIPAVIFGSLGCILFFQRPNSLTRIWLWLLPLVLIFTAAGVIRLTRWVMIRANLRYNLPGLVSVLLVVSMWVSVLPFLLQEQKGGNYFVEDKDVENVISLLTTKITQNDVVVVSNCANARYWYYSDHFHLNRSSFRDVKNRPFQEAYILVYQNCKDKFGQKETAQSVLQEFGPDRNFLDQKTLVEIARFENVTVYDILINPKTIQEAFGNKK